MKVHLIGRPSFDEVAAVRATDLVWYPASDSVSPADDLAEFAGRACYQSWHRPNPETATSEGYHANTLGHGHFSIYEHAVFVSYVEGISRALTHELVRHRHLSYSQLSQRFVAEDARNADPVVPPALQGDALAESVLFETYDDAMEHYRRLVEIAVRNGATRKQAREAARAVLPNAQETKIVVSGNVRAWREVIQRRIDPHADAEIQEFAREILGHLRREAPHSVQDLVDPKEA